MTTEPRSNAEIDASIAANIRATHVGRLLRDEGQTTIALDDDGNLVRHFPGGPSAVLESAQGDAIATTEPSTRELAARDAAIAKNLRTTNYGEVLAQAGITTVAVDDHGNLLRYLPDGTSVVREPEQSDG